MPVFSRGDVQIHYDPEGLDDGFPILLLAPGGMRSCNDRWDTVPWNPRRALAADYRLIGMDQRNAGRSSAPISATDGWATYTHDQLALLDHLGIERCHLVGMCIGGPFALALLAAAPERFTAAVLLQPAGIDGNRAAFDEVYDGWQRELSPSRPEVDGRAWSEFKHNMWGGEFVLAVDRDQVRNITAPVLVAFGGDEWHPRSISLEVSELAPDCTVLDRWKDDASLPAADATIRAFLARHRP
ncbi:MAG: alpha/beta hydrolase [Microthrixaceae bacterium]